MATRRWGVSKGENPNTGARVTEAVGAATAADNVEITVDLAANMTREEVLDAIEKITIHMMAGIWPPA